MCILSERWEELEGRGSDKCASGYLDIHVNGCEDLPRWFLIRMEFIPSAPTIKSPSILDPSSNKTVGR